MKSESLESTGSARRQQLAANYSTRTAVSNRDSDMRITLDDQKFNSQEKLIQIFAETLWTQVIVRTKSGAKFQGYLSSVNINGDIGVALYHAIQVFSPSGEGLEQVVDELLIKSEDFASMTIPEMDLIAQKTSYRNSNNSRFKIDSDISESKHGQPRDLTPWKPDPNVEPIDLSMSLSSSARRKWDQFSVNEKQFGVKSDYNEEIYTTKIDVNHPEFKEREARAIIIAAEIEKSQKPNVQIAEDFDCEDHIINGKDLLNEVSNDPKNIPIEKTSFQPNHLQSDRKKSSKSYEIDDLMAFSQNFKLNTPIPSDILPIISKQNTKNIVSDQVSDSIASNSIAQAAAEAAKSAAGKDIYSVSRGSNFQRPYAQKYVRGKGDRDTSLINPVNIPRQSTIHSKAKISEFKPNPRVPSFTPLNRLPTVQSTGISYDRINRGPFPSQTVSPPFQMKLIDIQDRVSILENYNPFQRFKTANPDSKAFIETPSSYQPVWNFGSTDLDWQHYFTKTKSSPIHSIGQSPVAIYSRDIREVYANQMLNPIALQQMMMGFPQMPISNQQGYNFRPFRPRQGGPFTPTFFVPQFQSYGGLQIQNMMYQQQRVMQSMMPTTTSHMSMGRSNGPSSQGSYTNNASNHCDQKTKSSSNYTANSSNRLIEKKNSSNHALVAASIASQMYNSTQTSKYLE